MAKRMVKVRLNKENSWTFGDSIVISTIFKNVWIPAKSWRWDDFDKDVVLVDEWCFKRHDLNPCQIVSGYIKTE